MGGAGEVREGVHDDSQMSHIIWKMQNAEFMEQSSALFFPHLLSQSSRVGHKNISGLS